MRNNKGKRLGNDHMQWLLAAADTFVRQHHARRAIVLLELAPCWGSKAHRANGSWPTPGR